VEIERGKRLSVGPAVTQQVQSPVADMHSLNFIAKMRECSRIDEENEKIISKLTHVPSTVLNQTEIHEHVEKSKKFLQMISRKGKVPAEQLTKLRDLFLRKQFPKVSSKLDLTTGGDESQLKKASLDLPIQQSKDTTNASTVLEEDSRVLPAIEDKKQQKKMA
jgi:hypothetical protein